MMTDWFYEFTSIKINRKFFYYIFVDSQLGELLYLAQTHFYSLIIT